LLFHKDPMVSTEIDSEDEGNGEARGGWDDILEDNVDADIEDISYDIVDGDSDNDVYVVSIE
ncbi:hypothetical protein C0991_003241, partial [Blastosporella zonata]